LLFLLPLIVPAHPYREQILKEEQEYEYE
jgi:hypothetical protein